MRRIVLLWAIFGAVGSIAGVQLSGYCVSWDDRIEHDVFQPLREKLQELSSEYENFSGADFGWFGWGVNWRGGASGNYSAFHLNKIAGQNSSTFCNASTERILSARFAYDDLRAKFKNVELYNPFFSLGNYESTLIFKGVRIYAYINASTNAKQCNASLGWLLLEGFDSLHLETSGGIFSWFATKIFNWIASPKIAAFLKSYTENQSISFQIKRFLAPAVQAQNEFFCKVMQ